MHYCLSVLHCRLVIFEEKFHHSTFVRMEVDISSCGSLGIFFFFGKPLLFEDLHSLLEWYTQIWVREISRQRKGWDDQKCMINVWIWNLSCAPQTCNGLYPAWKTGIMLKLQNYLSPANFTAISLNVFL